MLKILSQVACLGALLTILAVGVDPTIQQTLVVRTRMRDTMEDAYIPRSQSYLIRDLTEQVVTYSLDLYPTPGMIGAMYGGLFSSDNDASGMKSSSNVLPSCPTGNCTYPVFTSLAARSQCKDISERITESCSYYDIIQPLTAKSAKVCQFETPNGTFINQTLPTRDEDWDASYIRRMVAANQQVLEELEEGDEYDSAHGRFFSIQILRGNTTRDSMNYEAFQCTLSWCLNQYNTTVENGQLSETVVEGTLSESKRLYLARDLPNNYLLVTLSGSPNFTVSAMAEGGVVAWLQKSLQFSNSFVLTRMSDDLRPAGYNSTVWSWWSPSLEYSYENATLLLQDSTRLFLQEHPSDIMTRLAKAMTTYIRSQSVIDQISFDDGEASAQDTSMIGPVKGTAYALEIYVAVRWWWLSLAGTMLISTLAFFGYIASISERRRIPVWKSSPLALMFHGLTRDDNEGLRKVEGTHSMEKQAAGILVQLQNRGQGVGFELQN